MSNVAARSNQSTPSLDMKVFVISFITLSLVSALLIFAPQATAAWAQATKLWITDQFGWFYLLTVCCHWGSQAGSLLGDMDT